MSSLDTKNKTVDTDFKIGVAVSKSFVLGLGLEYAHTTENRNYFTYDQTTAREELMTVKSHAILPNIYLKYYKPFFTKFQFALNLNAGYGTIESEYSSITTSITPIVGPGSNEIGTGTSANIVSGYGSSSGINIFVVDLQPEIHYFITPTLGAMVQLGGVSYTLYGLEDHNWIVSLNPSTWSYGLFLRFGPKK